MLRSTLICQPSHEAPALLFAFGEEIGQEIERQFRPALDGDFHTLFPPNTKVRRRARNLRHAYFPGSRSRMAWNTSSFQ